MFSWKKVVHLLLAFVVTFSLFGSIHATTYAETGASGTQIGTAYVSFEDFAIRVEGDEGDYPDQLGVLIEQTPVAIYEGDTIADATLRLLDEHGIEADFLGDTKSGFYLSAISNFTTPAGEFISEDFGEFSAGSMSGWMITSNNWFINMGASEFLIEDGDIIKWQMTSQLGADLGTDWNNPSAEITGLNIEPQLATLSPAFSEEVEDYILTVPAGINSIKLEALQSNYWSFVTYTSEGQTYKLNQHIPIEDGTVIEIYSAYSEYAGDPPSDEDIITLTIRQTASN